jgi:hypothetical protein
MCPIDYKPEVMVHDDLTDAIILTAAAAAAGYFMVYSLAFCRCVLYCIVIKWSSGVLTDRLKCISLREIMQWMLCVSQNAAER